MAILQNNALVSEWDRFPGLASLTSSTFTTPCRARCLIHKSRLEKIPSFCKILDSKITHFINACHPKVKLIHYFTKLCVSRVRKFPKTYVRNASELCEWGTSLLFSCDKCATRPLCWLWISVMVWKVVEALQWDKVWLACMFFPHSFVPDIFVHAISLLINKWML
jgi:hypothetical protein